MFQKTDFLSKIFSSSSHPLTGSQNIVVKDPQTLDFAMQSQNEIVCSLRERSHMNTMSYAQTQMMAIDEIRAFQSEGHLHLKYISLIIAMMAETAVVTSRSWFPYFSCPSKSQRLAEAEGRILSALGIKYLARLIQIPFKNTEISTITVNCESEQPIVKAKYPIVLIHGFGAGVALWGSAIKRLAQFQTVHAFDLPGFGRSSRPKFSSDPETAETEMIDSIEQWRDKMNLEKMNLVGHSFGGYLATSYALKYPKRVENLILADPWGFNEMDPEFAQKLTSRQKNIFWVIQQFNPLAVLRLVGGYGPSLVRRLRPDLALKYSEDVYDYIYLANSRDPTGEEVFKCLSENLGWAKQPMSKRFHELDNTVPVTFIHGERSWIDWRTTRRLFGELEHVESHIMDSAGHHVYADDADKFVQLVIGSLKDGKTGELVPEEVNLEEEIVTPI